jgi:hypothetical protein
MGLQGLLQGQLYIFFFTICYYINWTLSVVSPLSKMSPCLCFETRRFGNWILSPSSGKPHSRQLCPIHRASPYLIKLNCTVVDQPRPFNERTPNTPEMIRGVSSSSSAEQLRGHSDTPTPRTRFTVVSECPLGRLLPETNAVTLLPNS